MNKKKIFSYLFLIVFLFSFFSVEVKAAEEIKDISCGYYNDSSEYAIKIAHDIFKNGGVYIAKKEDVVIDGNFDFGAEAWNEPVLQINEIGYYKGSETRIKVDHFASCPASIIFKEKGNNGVKDFLAFSSVSINVYSKKKDVKPNISMTIQARSKEFEESSTEIVDSKDHTYNGKTCDDVTWIENPRFYEASCLYALYIKSDDEKNSGCFVAQLAISENSKAKLFVDRPADNITANKTRLESLDSQYIKKNKDGYCPQALYAEVEKINTSNVYTFAFEQESNDRWRTFNYVKGEGNNLNDSSIPMGVFEEFDINFVDGEKLDSCEDIFDEDGELLGILKMLIMIFKISIPILLIVLGILDFAKAIFASDEGNMKKAQSKFIMRVIISVVIFLAPTLLKFLLSIAENIWPVISSDLCGLL